MSEQKSKTYSIELVDAHHLIGFGVPLPSDVKNARHIRKFTTSSKAELAEYVARQVQAGQRVALFVPEGIEDERSIVSILDDHEERLMVGERTLIKTAANIGKQILHNIYERCEVPYITDYHQPLKGVPAFIIYSGPSLDKNVELLARCQDQGVTFCHTTTAKVCEELGIEVDVGVCLESRKLFHTFGKLDPMVYVCDMTATAESWDVHSRFQARMYQPDLAYLQYGLADGTIPLGSGGFVGSTMVSLAYLWGADPIILLGFDLALTEGKMCSEHIEKGDFCDFSKSDMYVVFSGNHPQKGVSFTTNCKRWGDPDKTLKTTYERLGYIKYMEKFAKLAQDVELINASEGGAHLEGWREMPLKEALQKSGWHQKLHNHRNELYSQSRILAMRDTTQKRQKARETLEKIRAACNNIIALKDDKSVETEMYIRNLTREEPILFTWMAPQFVRLRYTRPDEKTRLSEIRRITVEAATEIKATIERVIS